MDEQLKKEATNFALHFWYVFVILFLFICMIFTWNSRENQRKKAEELQNRITMEGTIRDIEKRLEEVKQREAEYNKINEAQNKLKESLAALEKQRKELEKKKKENIKNEIKKMDNAALVNTFNSMGITSTIVTTPTK